MARLGRNPVKSAPTALKYKKHRVIIPFYIPNTTDEYYVDMVAVFKQCLDSLTSTINKQTTCISLINNASCKEASDVAESYVKLGLIDRYIVLSENRGKVEPCLLEVHASLEDYVTISDADILFYSGWEKMVFDIFNNIPRAGAVSPIVAPNSTFHFNTSMFMSKMCGWRSLKFISDGVDKESLNDFALSTENDPTVYYINRKDGFSWYDKQFILQQNGVKACAGAGHCCTTYKRFLLDSKPKEKVGIAFADGLEYEYIDKPIDYYGYYRLSLIKSLAYHLGNKPEHSRKEFYKDVNSICEINLVTKKMYLIRLIPYRLRSKLVSLYRAIHRHIIR